MGRSKDLCDFFEKTGTYVRLSRTEQTKVNKKLAKNDPKGRQANKK